MGRADGTGEGAGGGGEGGGEGGGVVGGVGGGGAVCGEAGEAEVGERFGVGVGRGGGGEEGVGIAHDGILRWVASGTKMDLPLVLWKRFCQRERGVLESALEIRRCLIDTCLSARPFRRLSFDGNGEVTTFRLINQLTSLPINCYH